MFEAVRFRVKGQKGYLAVEFGLKKLDSVGQYIPIQVIPSNGNPQMRWTLFDGYLFKYSNIVRLIIKLFTKYLKRHPNKHRTKKPPEKLSKCLQEPSTNLSYQAYFRQFSDW